ncbi:MAG: HDIG domain-containing protein [Planctomycetota bacterium]|nr:HDIG domain-containing protein [Planctomycetota bacterium]
MSTSRGRAGGKSWQRLSFGKRTTPSGHISAGEAQAKQVYHTVLLVLQILLVTFLIGWKSTTQDLQQGPTPGRWIELLATIILIHAGALLLGRTVRPSGRWLLGRTFLFLNGFLVSSWVMLQDSEISVMLLPVPLLGMVLGFLLRPSQAVLISGLAVVLTSLMVLERSPEVNVAAMGLAHFLGILVAVQGVQRVRSRTRILTVGFLAGLTQALAVLLLDPLAFKNIDLANLTLTVPLQDATWSLIGGVLAGVLITSALPFLERWFDVLTEIRLVELGDTHRPLLNEFSLLAPGSFQHSLMVGQLAEEAANSIGANGLLCRVGALYHDIGKMNKPGYFVENMQGGENVHDRLTPEMSRLVVIAHVKDGKKIALEERLPGPIVDMIPMHHGTSVVEFFFHKKARQVDESEADRTRDDFRYPGPRPTFREAGILMLADGVEASSRTLSDPTPARVKQHVKNIIQARINDEQLDNCELTMSDLHRIEDAFVRVLSAIHHGRVKYPTDDDGKSVGEKSSDSKTSGSKTSGSKSDKGEKEEGNSSDSPVTARRR